GAREGPLGRVGLQAGHLVGKPLLRLAAGGGIEEGVGGEAMAFLAHLVRRLEHRIDRAAAGELGKAEAVLPLAPQVCQRGENWCPPACCPAAVAAACRVALV